MRNKIISIMTMFILLFTAIGCDVINKPFAKKISDVKINTLELPEELNDMKLRGIYKFKNENKMYALAIQYNGDGENDSTYLYELNIKDKKLIDPKKIEIPDGYFIESFSVDPNDESKLYVSAGDGKSNIDIFKTEVKDNKLQDLNALDEINTEDNDFIYGLDKSGNIMCEQKSPTKNKTSIFYCEKKEDGTYSKTIEGKFTDGINAEIAGGNLSSDGNNFVYSSFVSNQIQTEARVYKAELKDGAWTNIEMLNSSVNKGVLDNLVPFITDDNKEVYYYQNNSYLDRYSGEKDDTVSRIAYVNLNDALIKEDFKETHDYDKVDFDMKYRNKSDEKNKQGVYYEIFVRSFADSNGDKIGDLNGVTAKLDYLKGLGIDGIYLMPINSSLSYHGYDVLNYGTINKDYGTMDDLQNLINEAHKRDMKVIMDFVVNHTSSQNRWFRQAMVDPNSKYHNYYRFVNEDDSENYDSAEKSAWGSEVWHNCGDKSYYGIFTPDMPDLNYNNTEVRTEIKNYAKQYLELGLDGFRIDAAMHIYGQGEFKKEENPLEKNLQWWNEFALACEEVNPNVYIVGECWHDNELLNDYAQPFDTLFDYAFEEDLMKCLDKENTKLDSGTLSSRLCYVTNAYKEKDSNYLNGVFAGNHDVNRIMSKAKSEEKAKLISNIYLTLSGNPFIYYGDELGMRGSKPDENLRTSFLWGNDDKMTASFMETYAEVLNVNQDTKPLSEQVNDENSMYNHYKNMIQLRKDNDSLTSGDVEEIKVDNDSVFAYKKKGDNQALDIYNNITSESVTFKISDSVSKDILYKSNDSTSISNGEITLAPYATLIIE